MSTTTASGREFEDVDYIIRMTALWLLLTAIAIGLLLVVGPIVF